MFDFTGKVVWIFLLAGFITTGTLAMTREGDLSFNVFNAVRIVWNAFVDLSDDANGSGLSNPTNRGPL